MIAFHYPPYRGSSGIQRTLKFTRFLPEHGWDPVVLSASPMAYPQVGQDQMGEIPSSVPVTRAFALDTARHMAIGGRYVRWMAQPDRWVSWWVGGVPAGLRLIRRYRPQVLWSTHPIATAHLIGLTLRRLTGIPWVADFRDSMLEDEYPEDKLTRWSYQWVEEKVVRYSSRMVFTTEAARRMYLERYDGLRRDRCVVIPNGFDEEDFECLRPSNGAVKTRDGAIRLLHSGLIYPGERDPRAFFRALARLKGDGEIDGSKLIVDLRASGSEAYYESIIRDLGIADLVKLLPGVSYREALQDCIEADGLILMQAASCNHLIPAKAYEYLRIRKPILALTSTDGDTAGLLREIGGATIVDLADEKAIHGALPRFLRMVREKTHPLPDASRIYVYDRRNQARELGVCLSELIHADS